jgi:hypothetical protein
VTINKRQRQVLRKRDYWGEQTALVLLDWLNSKERPKVDPVEALVRLQGHQELDLDVDPRQKSVELVRYRHGLREREKRGVWK